MAQPLSRIELSPSEIFYYKISSEWAQPKKSEISTSKESRQSLRKALFQSALKKEWVQAESLPIFLDLDSQPKMKSHHYSISHCPLAGGFSLSEIPHGLDIEDPLRVQNNVVLRVSDSLDLQASPSPSALWVAKESTFKCLRSSGCDITLLSDITTISFTKKSANSWSFSALRPQSVQGLVWLENSLILGLAYNSA